MGPSVSEGTVITSPIKLQGLYTFGINQNNKPVIDMYTFQGQITAANGSMFPLEGINQTYYWVSKTEHSHQNKIYLYTSAWGSKDRGNDGATTPTEVLIRNGIIEQISIGQKLDMLVPEDGYILRAAGTAKTYVEQNLKVGDPIHIDYSMQSTNPNNTEDPTTFKMLIGGHTILVKDGQAAQYSRDVSGIGGNRSRTGVGYTQDRRYVYLITADHSADSAGLTVSEFQRLMLKLGIYQGINLDGGGSTQLVSRPLGAVNPVLVNTTEFGGQRQIVNGIGVYSTAPQGTVKGIFVDGTDVLFIGEKASFSLRAYDQYYNPMSIGTDQVKWSVKNGVGAFANGEFVAVGKGTETISAVSGNAKATKEVRIIGSEEVQSLQLSLGQTVMVTPGTTIPLTAEAVLQDGSKRSVPLTSLEWEFRGFQGALGEQGIDVQSVNGTGTAQIIARYDGFSTMLTLHSGEDRLFADFDTKQLAPAVKVTPTEIRGAVTTAQVGGSSGNALRIDYDFTEGAGTKAVYAAFNNDLGVAVEGEPMQMKMDLYGDNSYNWVRAIVVDANGKEQYVDFTRNVNWTGWQTVTADLTPLDLAYPIKLKRIYVVNPEDGQDERAAVGSMAIDNIKFQYPVERAQASYSTVYFKVGSKEMNVDGIAMKVDQAPIVNNYNTMIPIRFIVDALGGEVIWNNQAKKLTIIKGDSLIDMWLDNPEMIYNGKRVTAPIAPQAMNGRTMVPLRFIAETLGWKVGWDQKTNSITLQ
ncbi:stalk domain-containing protein [Marinicrinis lubricantis]|uniref:Stalk domain-containing protein n=1 Tax=Marinicrinis lubricantis TaxID=2086470 RepID=A0ABW1ITN7_9BACL